MPGLVKLDSRITMQQQNKISAMAVHFFQPATCQRVMRISVVKDFDKPLSSFSSVAYIRQEPRRSLRPVKHLPVVLLEIAGLLTWQLYAATLDCILLLYTSQTRCQNNRRHLPIFCPLKSHSSRLRTIKMKQRKKKKKK